MIGFSSLHDISRFSSPEFPKARYDAQSHRLFATDGDIVVSVPVDGDSIESCNIKASGLGRLGTNSELATIDGNTMHVGKARLTLDTDDGPDMLSAFPESRPQVFIPIDCDSLGKLAAYATEHGESGEPVWLGITPSGTSDFVQARDNVLFFFVASDNGSRKLISGVINVPDVPAEDRQKVIGRSEIARKPRNFAATIDVEESAQVHETERHIRALRQRGYTVSEPGVAHRQQPAESAAQPRQKKRAGGVYKLVDFLRYISACDNNSIRIIVDSGFDVTQTDKNGNGVMIHAARFGNADTISIIDNANKTLKSLSDGNGAWNAVMHAIDAGKIANAKHLIALGSPFTQDHAESLGIECMELVQQVLS